MGKNYFHAIDSVSFISFIHLLYKYYVPNTRIQDSRDTTINQTILKILFSHELNILRLKINTKQINMSDSHKCSEETRVRLKKNTFGICLLDELARKSKKSSITMWHWCREPREAGEGARSKQSVNTSSRGKTHPILTHDHAWHVWRIARRPVRKEELVEDIRI